MDRNDPDRFCFTDLSFTRLCIWSFLSFFTYLWIALSYDYFHLWGFIDDDQKMSCWHIDHSFFMVNDRLFSCFPFWYYRGYRITYRQPHCLTNDHNEKQSAGTISKLEKSTSLLPFLPFSSFASSTSWERRFRRIIKTGFSQIRFSYMIEIYIEHGDQICVSHFFKIHLRHLRSKKATMFREHRLCRIIKIVFSQIKFLNERVILSWSKIKSALIIFRIHLRNLRSKRASIRA